MGRNSPGGGQPGDAQGTGGYQEGVVAAATAAVKSLQSCLTLCDSLDGSPPGSAVPGILQARTLEWVCHFLLQCMKVKSESEVAQLCPILSDPTDCSLPGSAIHGFFQARVLEWVAIALSKNHQELTLKTNFSKSVCSENQSFPN